MMAVYTSRDVGASTEAVQFITHFFMSNLFKLWFIFCLRQIVYFDVETKMLPCSIACGIPHKCTPFSILIGVLLSLYFSLSLCTMHNAQHACFQIFITNMNRTPNGRKINGKRDSKTLKRNGKNEITKIEMIERKNTSNCE